MARPKRHPEFSDDALDALLGDTKTAEELSVLFRQIQKRLAERILASELTAHLGYAPGEDKPADQSNLRNGTTPKTVLRDTRALALEIPRDREGDVPSAAGADGRAPPAAVRRECALVVRARRLGARDPGASRAAVSGRGLAPRD